MTHPKKRLLFVCTGNICRSPTAEGVARHLIHQNTLDAFYEVDSAGTQAYHVGEAPDSRTQAVARAKGYDLSRLRARLLQPSDYVEFDLLIAMGQDHLAHMQRQTPAVYRSKLSLMMMHARPQQKIDVPDPYYGGTQQFHSVLIMLENAISHLFRELEAQRQL